MFLSTNPLFMHFFSQLCRFYNEYFALTLKTGILSGTPVTYYMAKLMHFQRTLLLVAYSLKFVQCHEKVKIEISEIAVPNFKDDYKAVKF